MSPIKIRSSQKINLCVHIMFLTVLFAWFSSEQLTSDKDWHQQIHSATKEEMQMIALGVNKLDQYSGREDCFKSAALKLSKKCLVELKYEEKIGFAIELTLCELKTASLDPPLECIQLNQDKCVNALSRMPQWWTSFSGYIKETVLMCYSVRYMIEKEELTDIYRNITYLQLFNYNVLKKHSDEFKKLKDMTDDYSSNIKSLLTELNQQGSDLIPHFSNTKSIMNLVEDVMVSLSKQAITARQELLDLQQIVSASVKKSQAVSDKMDELKVDHVRTSRITQNNSIAVLDRLKQAQFQLDSQLQQYQQLYDISCQLAVSLAAIPIVNKELESSITSSSRLSVVIQGLNKIANEFQQSLLNTTRSTQDILTKEHLYNMQLMSETKNNMQKLQEFLRNMLVLVDNVFKKYQDLVLNFKLYGGSSNFNIQYVIYIVQYIGLSNIVITSVALFLWNPKYIIFILLSVYLTLHVYEYLIVLVFILPLAWALYHKKRFHRRVMETKHKKHKIQSKYRRLQ
eukprot:NODE_75_length_23373_cov_0.434261.p4 type:complete len:513 gc:universal NODE_75_length_23373_cov_0.434261:11228-9690(-)